MLVRIAPADFRHQKRTERLTRLGREKDGIHMKPIGIIGAMGLEVELLRDRMEDRVETVAAQRHFYAGKLGGVDAVVVCSGIGKVNAALTAQILIDRFDVSAVINTGIAGGTHPGIRVRDVVISDCAAYHDMDPRILALSPPNLREFPADPELVRKAEAACQGKVHYQVGRIATGDQFISDSGVKADIVSRLDPSCVEMEGGAVAHACAANGVPFVIIRCISDNADDEAEMTYDVFEKLAADDAAEIVTDMLKNW